MWCEQTTCHFMTRCHDDSICFQFLTIVQFKNGLFACMLVLIASTRTPFMTEPGSSFSSIASTSVSRPLRNVWKTPSFFAYGYSFAAIFSASIFSSLESDSDAFSQLRKTEEMSIVNSYDRYHRRKLQTKAVQSSSQQLPRLIVYGKNPPSD